MRPLLVALMFCCVFSASAEDSARAEARAIKMKPEYGRWARRAPGGDKSWADALSEWLRPSEEETSSPVREPERKRSERRVTRTSGASAAGYSLFQIMGYIFMFSAIAVLLYALVEGFRESGDGAAEVPADTGVGVARALAEGDALAYDDKTWRREAERLLGKGEIRQAYRSLYLSLLSGLHGQGRIAFVRNRTNWHYVRQFRGESGEAAEFAAMTGLFDEVWYGLHDAISGQGLIELRLRVDKLLRAGEGKR